MAWLTDLLTELPGVVRLAARLFSELRVDDDFVPAVRQHGQEGSVVLVMRHPSIVDALAVRHVAATHGLPSLGYAQGMSLLAHGPRQRRGASEADRLQASMDRSQTSLVFLERPQALLEEEPTAAADELLQRLIEIATDGQPITLIPVTMIWTMRAERERPSPLDLLFGPTDRPGDARAILQAVMALKRGALRMGEPLLLREFLRSQPADAGTPAGRRLAAALHRRLERDRRTVVGPRRKSPDRLRSEVLRSPRLVKLLDDMAGGDPKKRFQTELQARRMLTELCATPDPDLVRAVEPLVDRLIHRAFSHVDVEPTGLARLREASRDGTVVLLPSHKSHADYIVLSHVLRQNLLELPVVAAGDNLAFFPVGELLRRGGAFFIRRDFRGDRLYAAVVDAYVRRLLRDGYAIEFYLEGGRSRTGRLLSPQLGLLNLLVDSALSLENRPIYFIPVSIVYDRLLEDVELTREKAGAAKERESARSLVSVLDALSYDYGRVCVTFADPISLSEVTQALGIQPGGVTPAKRRAVTNRLASLVMSGIHTQTPLSAGSLVATALLDMPGRGLSHPDLVARCGRLLLIAQRHGAKPAACLVHSDGRLREAIVREAANVFVRGGLVREHLPDDTLGRRLRATAEVPGAAPEELIYTVPEEARSRLDIVKGQGLHFFADRALVALAFLGTGARVVPLTKVLEDACLLGGLLSHELTHLCDGPLEVRIRWTMEDMVAFGELGLLGDTVVVGKGHELGDAMVLLTSHASHLIAVIESLRIATRSIRSLANESISKKALLARALQIGKQMFLGGEIDRREAPISPTLASAFEGFVDRGLLKRARDGYELADDTSEEKLRALEAYLATASLRHAASIPRGIS